MDTTTARTTLNSMENSDISSREILDTVRKIIEEDDPPQPSDIEEDDPPQPSAVDAEAICKSRNNVSSFLYICLVKVRFFLFTRDHTTIDTVFS
jgi:hypothetical protein